MNIITTALPYANGPLHCGHVLEAMLADIRVRYLRDMEEKVIFISGQDAHGAAITISANVRDESEEEYIESMHQQHVATYAKSAVVFDCFSSTDSEYNKQVTLAIYQALKDKGCVREVTVNLPYDPMLETFLADRFISGECPRCHAMAQHGDHCEVCGATYGAQDLINPISRNSQSDIVWKERVHVVVELEKSRDVLQSHLKDMDCIDAVKNKLAEWFDAPLRHWDITRNAPYFGFEIPDRPSQYFYVWLDAPCGYLSALQEAEGLSLTDAKTLWNRSHITHVIGKDITYFHGLFWPAMLHAYDLKMPDAMMCHGFVTLSGEKMSKSKGTFILADTLLEGVGSDALRYYFATKISENIADIDMSCDDFMDRVHADLIGKCINLGSRLSGFVHRHGQGVLSEPMDQVWLEEMRQMMMPVHEAYRNWDYALVTRIIMKVCDAANQWVDHHAPWKAAKTDPHAAWQTSSTALQVYRWVLMALQPICPDLCQKGLMQFPASQNLSHGFAVMDPVDIATFVPLLSRFDREELKRLFGESE